MSRKFNPSRDMLTSRISVDDSRHMGKSRIPDRPRIPGSPFVRGHVIYVDGDKLLTTVDRRIRVYTLHTVLAATEPLRYDAKTVIEYPPFWNYYPGAPITDVSYARQCVVIRVDGHAITLAATNDIYRDNRFAERKFLEMPPIHTAIYHPFRRSYLVGSQNFVHEINDSLEKMTIWATQLPHRSYDVIPSRYSAGLYTIRPGSPSAILYKDGTFTSKFMIPCPMCWDPSMAYVPDAPDILTVVMGGSLYIVDPWHTSRTDLPQILLDQVHPKQVAHISRNICVVRGADQADIIDIRCYEFGNLPIEHHETYMWCTEINGWPMIITSSRHGGVVYL